ncbi:MAG: O-antigen ligase family protein [Tenuifilaceae bacterium]
MANIILLILYASLFLYSFKKFKYILFIRNLKLFLWITSFLFISIYFILTQSSYQLKSKIINTIGINNCNAFQHEITKKFYRYYKIFNQKKSLNEFYISIWSPKFDSYDPDSGWGTRIHKTIYPLTGKNVDILPYGVKGYLMDSTCNADVWNGNSYSFTIIDVPSNLAKNNDTIELTVFCYVSENFNGEWACLTMSINNEGPWAASTFYDIGKKGTWQKLSITQKVSLDQIFISLYFAKLKVNNFSSLKGYVIFAYPSYKNISQQRNISVVNRGSIYYQFSPKKIKELSSSYTFNELYENSIGLSFFSVFTKMNLQIEKDPIRNLASRFISEDTVYIPYKPELNVGIQSERRGDDRILLWKFAIDIWIKEYNLSQKIFGRGFAFLNWYGYYFTGDKTQTGYPHNPFLYILLYSGIVGVLLYIILLYKVFYYYIKYIKEYYLFFIFFLITYFFTFFSGGNPFDPPIMGFFMMLPFFIHYIHQKDNEKKEEETKDSLESAKDKVEA